MANITLRDLYSNKYAASGVYTIYRDETQAPAVDTSPILRLVAGFSKKGPFNIPVLIERGDIATAVRLFGDIDYTLERKGSFFHRSLLVALEEGPVLALNLLKTQDQESGGQYAADYAAYNAFSTSLGEVNPAASSKLYSSYFNKERFWTADKNYLLATRAVGQTDYIFNLVNLSNTPATYLIKKSDITGFDVTVEEWYGNDEVPPYLKPHDYISDYFIDVFVIDGNFGPDKYGQLDTDPVYGEFFNSKGLIKGKLTDFLARAEVNVRQIYTGCVIPNFKDKQGVPYYIEDVINNQFARFGVLCAIDKDQIDAIEFGTNTKNLDLVGHSLISTALTEVDFLSYKKRIKEDKAYIQAATNTSQTIEADTGRTITYATGKVTITFTDAHTNFAYLENNAAVGDLIDGTRTAAGLAAGVPVASPVLEVTSVTKTTNLITIVATNDFKLNETATSGSLVDIDLTGVGSDEITYTPAPARFKADGTDTYYVVDKYHQLYIDYQAGLLADGDTITDTVDTYYAKFIQTVATGGVDAADDYRDILKIELYTDADLTTAIGAGNAPAVTTTVDSNGYTVSTANSINIVSVIGDLNTTVTVTEKV
jgi:hypothetical protein